MSAGASVVAYYGEKDPGSEFAGLVTEVQERTARELGECFHARELHEVHATIIGLEIIRGRPSMSDLFEYLRERFKEGEDAVTIQFGGFAPAYRGMLSRGLTLYERSFTIMGRDVMLMGWPVEEGQPSGALDVVRRECGRRGFEHKYHTDESSVDADCYVSVGWLDGDPGDARLTEASAQLRGHLSRTKIKVPLTPSDIGVAVYEDRNLPRASTKVCSL